MNLKTALTWAAVAFAVWWTIQDPHAPGQLMHNIGAFIVTAATGLDRFAGGK